VPLPRCTYCKRLLDGGHERGCPVALVDDGTVRRCAMGVVIACWAALIALACAGGYQQLPTDIDLDAAERHALVLAEVARWEAQLGPQPRCREESARLVWTTAPVDEVSRRCTTASPLSGCFRYRGDGPGNPPVPEITVSEDTPRTDKQLLIVRLHELKHWGLQCSGVDPTGDPGHTRAEWIGL
jgi:hypothetical protein